jgi:acyl carrier protein
MNREDILTSLREAASEILDLDPNAIEESTVFADDLDIDSVDVLDMALLLERQYDIQFEEADLRELATAGDVVTLIQSKLVTSDATV